jgi:hypothetical protein
MRLDPVMSINKECGIGVEGIAASPHEISDARVRIAVGMKPP